MSTRRRSLAAAALAAGLVILGVAPALAADVTVPTVPKTTKAAATGDNNVGVIDLSKLELVDRLKTGTGPDGMAWVPAK